MSAQSVELCQSSDIPELFERFADWYRFNPRLQERDYFDWQFKDAPTRLSKGEYDFLILRENNKIVGCLGFTGFEFASAGRINVGGWTHNWYAQDQRDGGLALLFRFMELADNRFIFRFNENTSRVFSLLKVPIISAVSRWWAVVDAHTAADVFQVTTDDQAVLSRSASGLARASAADTILAVPRFDHEDRFELAHLGSELRHALRNGRYLNWRYFDIPHHRYHAIRSERGLGVYRIETVMNHDVSVVRIVEWTFDAVESGAALASILQTHHHAKPILLDFHCTAECAARGLQQFGFMAQSDTARPVPDLFRPTNYSGGNALAIDLPPHRTTRSIDFGQWYITAGDSDVDRVKL